MRMLPFRDRDDAGRRLAHALARFRDAHPLILAIPRGAVPMARIVADALHGDLDLILVRKLGAPGNPELAIGAVDERGALTLDRAAAARVGADDDYLRREAARQSALIRERRHRYCGDRPGPPLRGRTVIVVDDGLATGATMLAALQAARTQRPARLICAVPVAAPDSLARVREVADEVVALASPAAFGAVGEHYLDFSEVDDAAVIAALAPTPIDAVGSSDSTAERAVVLRCEAGTLRGDLRAPPDARALVLFAHGSGSSRRSVRNRFVADALNRAGFATLLFDLLTEREDRDPRARFDIDLLARRLRLALSWAQRDIARDGWPVALFGASTGAAAALILAAQRPDEVVAVISRGGRPDLAGDAALRSVRAPTLLLVGGEDHEVLALNRHALARLGRHAQLIVIPGATHLFEEPGALEAVAEHAIAWLARHVPARGGPRFDGDAG